MSVSILSILLSLVFCCVAQKPVVLPLISVYRENGSCPSAEVLDQNMAGIKQESLEILHRQRIVAQSCPCGGPGEWREIVHRDMSDPIQQCPTNWTLITTPLRGCGRKTAGDIVNCDSAIFPTNGQPYSRVCGRIRGYLKGQAEAFRPFNRRNQSTLDSAYMTGISISHGLAGSRQHIWSFASAFDFPDSAFACSCAFPDAEWPYEVPSFVGNNYFCESGPVPENIDSYYLGNPLWDGEGCGSPSTCCQFNTPPWFCATLPKSTSDDIELRTCYNGPHEDVLIDLIDIYATALH